MSKDRMILRMIEMDAQGAIVSIIEQEIPVATHAVELFLRRAPAKGMAAHAVLSGGKVTIESKESGCG